MVDAVDEGAEPRLGDSHDVADVVREAGARCVAILDRREHRAAEQHRAIRVFPALVLGVFWKRANKLGAIIGMSAGLFICGYYMYLTYPFFGVNAPLWWDITPISSGIFGIPAGFIGVIVGSLISPAPSKEVQDLVDHVRYPNLAGDIDTSGR